MSDERNVSRPTEDDGEASLEPWLQALADDYNRPPPVPRELLWARIQAARVAGAGADDADERVMAASEGNGAVGDGASSTRSVQLVVGEVSASTWRAGGVRHGGVGGRAGGRGVTLWRRPSLGMAAALLLIVALAWWRRSPEGPAPAMARAIVVSAESASADLPGDSLVTSSASGPAIGLPEDSPVAEPTLRRERTASSSVASGSANVTRLGSNAAIGGDAADIEATFDSAPYRIVAAQHLGQVEALLTIFHAESGRDVADPSLQLWARELLTTTRLLLDSPAARDRQLDLLLGELEPVLVQIVQLPAARAAEEHQLIARSLEQSSLMTQLRSAVPAGSALPLRAGE